MYNTLERFFPKRCREIPAIDGGVLLQQVRIGKNFYLHRFLKPEPEGVYHCHRWDKMRSFVLWGSYTEERLYPNRETKEIKHRMFTTFKMDKSAVHRIKEWRNAWTLFYFKGEGSNWGYLDKDFNYTHWEDYIPEDKRVGHV